MNLLPAMLITTAVIGGTGSLSADAFQNLSDKNYMTGQVIIGNSSNLESVLNEFGIDMDVLKECIKPAVPDINCPENNKPGNDSETPDTNLPDNDTNKPDTDVPDNDTNAPDNDVPDNDTNTPDADAPGNDTNKPDNGNSGNDGSDTEQDSDTSYAKQVVDLVNAERAKAGLSALTMRDDLNSAALIRAQETIHSFSHTRPNGSSFTSVLNENGISYRGAGENIAWGQQTPEAVVNAWMNSEGHRANILNKNYTSIGVGYYLNNATPYWAQLFTY